MNKIELSNWAEFKISELFNIERPAKRSKNKYEKGGTPFVSSGSYNNGVADFLTPDNENDIDKGNCLTVSPVDGTAFYQKDDFLGRGGGGSSIIIFRNDNLNEYNGLFIATIITKSNNYQYNDMGQSDLTNTKRILLPITEQGQPDWKYMEEYIKGIEIKQKNKIEQLKKIKLYKNSIDTKDWKEFKIKDFCVTDDKGKHVPTGAIVSAKNLVDGDIAKVSVSGVNNGIVGYYNSSDKNFKTYENFVSVSFLGTAFYQEKKTYLDMKVHCVKPKNFVLNLYTGLFLATAIKNGLKKYNYSDQISSTVLAELYVKLPVKDSEPDWSYMETYIKDIENKQSNKLTKLKELLD